MTLKPAGSEGVTAFNITMNTIKSLTAFLVLTALSYAGSADFPRHIVDLPPVLVEASRVTMPVVAALPSSDEVRAQADLTLRGEVQRNLEQTGRHLAAAQRRELRAVEVPALRPSI